MLWLAFAPFVCRLILLVTLRAANTRAFVTAYTKRVEVSHKLQVYAVPYYLRWHKESESDPTHKWNMQTAVTTFQKENSTLELHAQLHFGTHEYFDYYNTQFQSAKKNNYVVLYELLVDEQLLGDNNRLLQNARIQASRSDQAVAQRYGWACQADVIQYNNNCMNHDRDNWIHADLTRQELLRLLLIRNDASSTTTSSTPLWRLASSASQRQTPEALTALLLGPPFLASTNRQLFTNLFLQGSSLALAIRALLWFTVPSPELSILLLDWSSLTDARLSRSVAPLVRALERGQWQCARQIVFGQVALLAHVNPTLNNNNKQYALMTRRNERAIQVVKEQVQRNNNTNNNKLALLYGCNHCRELHQLLVADGYESVQTEWRTAWSVQLDNDNDSSSVATTWSSLVLVSLYLGVGGLDWIAAWREFGTASDGSEAIGFAAFYLLRHVLLYVGLAKSAFDIADED
jgi:hypothetical protein